ncbi:MAG: metal-dependent hydrolase [Myxococcota bacterium]|nr:metal-dependent hydrolase [Myxococcota bacterium]
MDIITQVTLGTCIGEAFFRKKLGKRALFFGAFCGLFPDLDILLHSMSSFEGLQSHRGLSHSVLFLPIVAPILGGIMVRLFRSEGSYRTWTHLAFWALITHPLLDVCTTYGTQLLYPISTTRFSTNGIAIIDLFYTLPLLIVAILSLRMEVPKLARSALFVSSAYLGLSHFISFSAIQYLQSRFVQYGFEKENIHVSPVLLFSPLRRVVAKDDQGNFITAMYSPFAKRPPSVHRAKSVSNAQVDTLLTSKDGATFLWFANHFVLVERQQSAYLFIDTRYGSFSKPWFSPFIAQASINADGSLGQLKLARRGREINIVDELKLGWKNIFLQ